MKNFHAVVRKPATLPFLSKALPGHTPNLCLFQQVHSKALLTSDFFHLQILRIWPNMFLSNHLGCRNSLLWNRIISDPPIPLSKPWPWPSCYIPSDLMRGWPSKRGTAQQQTAVCPERRWSKRSDWPTQTFPLPRSAVPGRVCWQFMLAMIGNTVGGGKSPKQLLAI